MAKAARELGCSRCSTYILPYHDELDFQSNFELHSIRLGRVATILTDYGIRFGLEFMAPKTLRDGHKFEFIYTMGRVLELCDAIGTGSVGILLDSWHWYNAHGTVDDFKRLCDELVVNVHISDAPAGLPVDEQVDNVRCLPGETGVIDIVGFLRGLQQISYTGPVLVEPYSERINRLPDAEAVKVVVTSLRDVWRKAGL
jgi:sugar phosphate isomerase/epimerase